MTNKEKETKITEILSGQDLFEVKSVDGINHKPHPFCIGPEHIKRFALDMSKGCTMRTENHDGTGAWTNGYKKGYYRCGLPFEAHTSDNVCFLSLKRNGTNDEANIILKTLVDKIGEKFVDGFIFVETDEKFRIS